MRTFSTDAHFVLGVVLQETLDSTTRELSEMLVFNMTQVASSMPEEAHERGREVRGGQCSQRVGSKTCS